MEFSITAINLSGVKANQHMSFFSQTLKNFEEDLRSQIIFLIDSFFDR
jgi:hypothetical protein